MSPGNAPAALTTAARAALFSVLAMVFLALLAGCASAPPATPIVRSQKPPAEQFSLVARLSVRVDNRLDVVRLRWTRERGEERIGFFSPFGSQVAELTQPAAGPATLQRGRERQTAASINELTESLLGVSLDIDQAALWIQAVGLNVDEPRDLPARDGSLWRVTLEGIAQENGYDHATRLSAVKDGIMVKMVIEEWQAR